MSWKLEDYVVAALGVVHYPEVHGAHFIARCAVADFRVAQTYPSLRWSQSELVSNEGCKATCLSCIAEGPSIAWWHT